MFTRKPSADATRPKASVTAHDSRRAREAKRLRLARTTDREVHVPSLTPAQARKRKRLERDDAKWLRFFFPDAPYGFWYPFTQQQQAIIRAIGFAIKHGGDQAIAASRGEGKTQLARRLCIKYTLSGTVSFVVLFASTGSDAADSLEAIRADIQENDLLCEYYPEVCVPVRALENTPNRAHYQTVTGHRHDTGAQYAQTPSRFHWCGHELSIPNVPGSPSAGAIIATRGLDSAVRGLNKKGRRPDVAIIDDPDTEETASNPQQAAKLEKRIDRAIAGLGSQQRPIARVMLTTLQNRICVSYRYTDPMAKPSWKGKRFRFLVKPPKNQDLWQQYVQMVQDDLRELDDNGEPLDPHARRAHALYLQHRKAMDLGGAVANRHRYDPSRLADGSQKEISALQRYYNEVARIGPDAVATEYDNAPPDDDRQVAGISPRQIQLRLSGLPYRVVPDCVLKITQGIDVGKRWLHWVVRAWVQRSDDQVATGYTIDYGETPTSGTVSGSEEGIDEAIKRALRARAEQIARDPYCTAAGKVCDIDLTLIDCQYRMEAIYDYCIEAGQFFLRTRNTNGRFSPSAGVGASNGAIREDWRQITHSTDDTIPGDFWKMSKQANGIWQTRMHADSWKLWEHDRWMGEPDAAGGLLVWGESPTAAEAAAGRLSYAQRQHRQPFPSGLPGFADQICAEIEAEEVRNNVTIRRWISGENLNMKHNHLFDAAYRADVAASMLGVPLLGRRIVAAVRPRRRVSLQGVNA